MFNVLRARMGKRDEGFSLIELMIVVLIIAILIAIAIPTFLGARSKSQDRAAQVDLRQGLLTAKSHYTDTEMFCAESTVTSGTCDTDAATATEYEALEPSLDFAALASANTATVGVDADTATILLARESASGSWFCIAEDVTTGTTYGSGANLAAVDTLVECAGASW